MSKKSHNPAPVPAGNRQKSGTDFEEPNQDESGKTAAPQDEQGLKNEDDQKARHGGKREEPRPM